MPLTQLRQNTVDWDGAGVAGEEDLEDGCDEVGSREASRVGRVEDKVWEGRESSEELES